MHRHRHRYRHRHTHRHTHTHMYIDVQTCKHKAPNTQHARSCPRARMIIAFYPW